MRRLYQTRLLLPAPSAPVLRRCSCRSRGGRCAPRWRRDVRSTVGRLAALRFCGAWRRSRAAAAPRARGGAMSRHTSNRVNLPASRYGRSRPSWGTTLNLPDAPGQLLRTASSFFRDGGKELLRRTAPTAPMYHPALPGPPAWGCFTAPPFQADVAAEALLGMLSTNIFWVGLWDLLDNTIFPNDTNGQMFFLIVAGTIGLYFTDSLYEPENDMFAPRRPRADEGTRLRSPLEPPSAVCGDSDDELLPLTNTSLGVEYEAVDEVCVAPRIEIRRLVERVIANVAAVLLWTGIWTQIEAHLMPPMCSSDELCQACPRYGEFPCAWYKIAFVFIGLIGQFYTRSLYNDTEVTYSRRDATLAEQCADCGWRSRGQGHRRRGPAART